MGSWYVFPSPQLCALITLGVLEHLNLTHFKQDGGPIQGGQAVHVACYEERAESERHVPCFY